MPSSGSLELGRARRARRCAARPFRRPGPLRTLAATGGLALAAACGGGGGDSGPARIEPGEVLTSEVLFVDASRPTPPNNGAPGRPDRSLATRLWWSPEALRGAPACGGSACALVVLAHGYGGSTARFDRVGRGLAAAGYVVAAPAFPLTNDRAPGGHTTGLGDAVQQPADLSFLLDELTSGPVEGGPPAGRIDPERIGVVGHSLGAATVLGLTRRPCCRDDRVGATAVVAPVTALVRALFGGDPTPEGGPLLVLNGRLDPTATPAVARDLYEQTVPPHALVVLEEAGHSDLIEDFGEEELLAATTDLLVAYLDRFLGRPSDPGSLTAGLDDLRRAGHEVASDL